MSVLLVLTSVIKMLIVPTLKAVTSVPARLDMREMDVIVLVSRTISIILAIGCTPGNSMTW